MKYSRFTRNFLLYDVLAAFYIIKDLYSMRISYKG